MPDLYPGSLLIFPAELIHAVNPYGGERPRITLSWNINLTRLPGDRAEGWRHDHVTAQLITAQLRSA